jgi:hypothetical protein
MATRISTVRTLDRVTTVIRGIAITGGPGTDIAGWTTSLGGPEHHHPRPLDRLQIAK